MYTSLLRDSRLTKMAVTQELVGISSSYITRQKVISDSWRLTNILGYSPLKSTSSTDVFYHQKLSWNLLISIASDQITAGSRFGHKFLVSWSWFIRGLNMSFDTVVNRSQVTLENCLTCRHLSHHIGGAWLTTYSWMIWQRLTTHSWVTCERENMDIKLPTMTPCMTWKWICAIQ